MIKAVLGNNLFMSFRFETLKPFLSSSVIQGHEMVGLTRGRAVQLTVFQLIINGNEFVTFNRTNRLITAVISDPLHSL